MIQPKHVLNPNIKNMRCIQCGKEFPVGDYFYGCPDCAAKNASSSLTFAYTEPLQIDDTAKGIHRYKNVLPYDDAISLGEGNTPVLNLQKLADELRVAALYTKNEFQNPTGSHKDRMNPFIVARASEKGYDTVTCASSGNEAASLAAYAAAEGLHCVNVSTDGIPFFWKNASLASDAEIVLTETSALRLAYQREKLQDKDNRWYCATNLLDVPSSSSPFGIQGYKVIAFEIYEQFNAEQQPLPDYIFIPTCRGDLLYGIYEGFENLKEAGYIRQIPHLVACEPIPRLELVLEQGAKHQDKFAGDSSQMSSIGGNTTTYQAEYALRNSNGFAISVSGDKVEEAIKAMGRHGLYLESSSAIVYHCVQKALLAGKLTTKDSVMLMLTSSGYKNKIKL